MRDFPTMVLESAALASIALPPQSLLLCTLDEGKDVTPRVVVPENRVRRIKKSGAINVH